MAKKKRGGGGHGRGGRHINARSRGPDLAAMFSSPRTGPHTMQDEARNTSRHLENWDTDHKLRYSKISFVSAGNLHPSPLYEDGEEEEEVEDTTAPPESGEGEPELDAAPSVEDQDDDQEVDQPPLFVVDLVGDPSIKTSLPPPEIRGVSPTPSSSSEEVILFRGRDKPATTSSSTDEYDAKIRVIEDKIHVREKELESSARQYPQTKEIINLPTRSKGRRKSDRIAYEDAILQDYIQNMKDQEEDGDEMFASYNMRDIGGSDGDVYEETPEAQGKAPKDLGGWDSSALDDLDGMSTSDGDRGTVEMILSKRSRPSGVQYLVVWENDPVDDARWVNLSTLQGCGCELLIQGFEEEEKRAADIADTDSDSDDSESSDIENLRKDIIEVEFDDDDDDDDDDEDDVEESDKEESHMSDETLARLLAKQEQLGMGSGDLVLFDGSVDFGDADEDTSDVAIPWSSKKTRGRKDHQHDSKRGKEPMFPSATRLADAYDGFDIMDFERPSLQKKPKSRKGKLPYDVEVSDSDLAETMQETWAKDRLRKKERKQQREELRAQGLLGSKNGKVNMKDKYKEGMTFDNVRTELSRFLRSADTTLALAPMDKKDRKIVHEFAAAFLLKSKSNGSGSKRFPILYRTQRTRPYSDSAFAAVEMKLQRRFLPRMDVRGSGRSLPRPSRGGGAGNAAVSYRDGDVVGASAPEIGADNKGRAMLEKMGWSSGTALGAINNKGILIPVSHVVKTTKAGLG